MSKITDNLPVEAEQPTDEAIIAAGIDLEDWNDPEAWDDKERAFFWEWKARQASAADEARQLALAERLMLPAMWDFLLPFIERLCGRVHRLDRAANHIFYDWREKVIFAGVRLDNCEIAVELNTLAKVEPNDVLVSEKGDKVYRVVHKENFNDRNYVFCTTT